MPRSRGRRGAKRATRRGPAGPRSLRPSERGIPPIDGLVGAVLRGGRELLEVEDPLDAERWASQVLGSFYKLPIPLSARDELEATIGPAIVEAAEAMGGPEGLAILLALASVLEDDLRGPAEEAAERLRARGIPEPAWAEVIGRPAFEGAWRLADPYDDQLAYFATFRYPDRPGHVVMALYDENLGGIIKDAAAGIPRKDPRPRAERRPGARVSDADPGEMASRITGAIRAGDLYLDNDWTESFRHHRALLLARMRLLPAAPLPEPPEPPDEGARAALTAEFLASPFAPEDPGPEVASIIGHCLDARCDYGDGDPLRWSPIVVELFMLDFLPRKATLDAAEIRALPEVLAAWVRFALTRRGLEERWIAETERMVRKLAPEFRRAATDPSRFGPAKAIAHAMLADGVDLTDQRAVDAWIRAFNARPQEDRDAILGPRLGLDP